MRTRDGTSGERRAAGRARGGRALRGALAIAGAARLALAGVAAAPVPGAAAEGVAQDAAAEAAAREAFELELEEWTLLLHNAAPRPAPGDPVRIQCVPSDEALARLAGDFVVHGRLEVEDFRAPAPEDTPLAVAIPGGELGAQVGLTIVCVGRPRVVRTPEGGYEAGMETLRYVALLDRDRSWWSPRSDPVRADVLRHEQCHFDLAEAQARRLDAAAEVWRRRSAAAGATPREAAQAFLAGWRAHLEAVRAEMHEIQTRYDRETRHGSDPARQAAWLARCAAELEAFRGR